MKEKLHTWTATYHVEAESLQQTLALLTDILQRTGIAPQTILTPSGKRLTWNKSLALKVTTGKITADTYTEQCTLE